MHNDLAIIGASGHGKVVADVAEATTKYDEVVFFDIKADDKKFFPYEVFNDEEFQKIPKYKEDYEFIVAIGNNEIRQRITEQLTMDGFQIATLIHPTATIGSRVKIGAGSVVVANAAINCDTIIGKGAIINTGATVDHDCKIGDYVHISPGVNLAGTVRIGNLSWCGIGATIINNIEICELCLIGAGSTVIRDIIEAGTYFGTPAIRVR
ncbi:acetyltransferase [Lentisphaerota bacterium WC36G]|nr:acetyltransferase [Lentisphaerae bacterium WC36]